MRGQINRAVAKIFEGYVDTPELEDFKEEIAMNLWERVRDMQKKGMTEKEALHKALEELGDVTEAADAVSRQKRQEVIGQAYIRSVPLDKSHAVGYTVAGLLLAVGIVLCVITGFTSGILVRPIAAMTPFLVISGGAFVYLGLTQETSTHKPMSKKRGLWYGVAAGFLLLGACLTGMVLFRGVGLDQLMQNGIGQLKFELISQNPVASLGTLVILVLPALALLAFLVLTEKDRKKPWVIHMQEEQNQIYNEKFGYLSGALWIFAIALFLLMGMLVSWRISWIVFLFAICGELLLLYGMSKSK